jgi:predicted nucleotide-binding protein
MVLLAAANRKTKETKEHKKARKSFIFSSHNSISRPELLNYKVNGQPTNRTFVTSGL